jgi:hypothetical protein
LDATPGILVRITPSSRTSFNFSAPEIISHAP